MFLASATGEQPPATVQLVSVSAAQRTLLGKNVTFVVLNIMETHLLIRANVRAFDFYETFKKEFNGTIYNEQGLIPRPTPTLRNCREKITMDFNCTELSSISIKNRL